MEIEELAFKNYYELKDIPKVDLLLIIEFLQKDRNLWINEYTRAHNDYIDLQQENSQLKEKINKAIEYIIEDLDEPDFEHCGEIYVEYEFFTELLEILKGDKEC